jgi:hypothetical protein
LLRSNCSGSVIPGGSPFTPTCKFRLTSEQNGAQLSVHALPETIATASFFDPALISVSAQRDILTPRGLQYNLLVKAEVD